MPGKLVSESNNSNWEAPVAAIIRAWPFSWIARRMASAACSAAARPSENLSSYILTFIDWNRRTGAYTIYPRSVSRIRYSIALCLNEDIICVFLEVKHSILTATPSVVRTDLCQPRAPFRGAPGRYLDCLFRAAAYRDCNANSPCHRILDTYRSRPGANLENPWGCGQAFHYFCLRPVDGADLLHFLRSFHVAGNFWQAHAENLRDRRRAQAHYHHAISGAVA